MPDLLQRQRFEFKYRISARQVPALREFVRAHLQLDSHGEGQPDFSYPIHSIYLDSPDLRLCRATHNGDRNRFKLRLRSYTTDPDEPVYCEIKRRENDSIRKQRAAVRRETVAGLLTTAWPSENDLVEPDARGVSALWAFWENVRRLQATPTARVVYRREAWVCHHGNAVRVTFDRAVSCVPLTGLDLSPGGEAVPVFGDEVILEVKFTDRFPCWVTEMVERFELVRASAAKYADGIAESGIRRLVSGGAGGALVLAPPEEKAP